MADLKGLMAHVTAQSVRELQVTDEQAIAAELARWLDAIVDARRRMLPYAQLDTSYVSQGVVRACAEEVVSRGFRFSEHGNNYDCRVCLEWL